MLNLRNTRNWIFCLFILLGSLGCRNTIEEPVVNHINGRGRLISAELLQSYSLLEMDSLINSIDPFLNIFFRKDYPVEVYKLTYETITFDGQPTMATGALAIPVTDTSAALASYAHGTTIRKEGVPSRLGGESNIGLLMAMDGYAMCMPDYLGLGDGPGFHPYIHAKSEATATVDMLRAARQLASDVGLELDGKLFLTGYSQGGHAALAAHREIEQLHQDEFNLTGSAPMSGPYDASGVQEQVLVGFDPYPTPGYLPFILWSYNMVYDIVPDPAALLKPPYDSIIPPLMDQIYSIGYINTQSNAVPRYMLLDSVLNAYENDQDHPLKLALRDNDLWKGWVPQAPVRFFYCEGDDQVAYENSIVAYNAFTQNGAQNVSLFRVDSDAAPQLHSDCAPGALLRGKLYFDSLRFN